jgi:hypothetical protein
MAGKRKPVKTNGVLPFTRKNIEQHWAMCCEIAEKEQDFDKLFKLLCWESDRMYGRPAQQITGKIDTDVTISVQIGEKSLPAIDVTPSLKDENSSSREVRREPGNLLIRLADGGD